MVWRSASAVPTEYNGNSGAADTCFKMEKTTINYVLELLTTFGITTIIKMLRSLTLFSTGIRLVKMYALVVISC